MAQNRRLTNAGLRADLTYVKGVHNIKAGVQAQHWFLDEHFNLGITDPTFNPVCFSDSGLTMPVIDQPTITNPAQCSGAGFFPNTTDNGFAPGLVPFDLTRGGSVLNFNGHADIKETSLYVQDAITLGNWSFNLGIRGDLYYGLSSALVPEPRAAAAYHVKRTGTVLRGGYARAIVTPYNENLIVSSSTGIGGLGSSFGTAPPKPGYRNLYNVGLEQAFGKYLLVTGDYYWKYTSPDYDFDVLFSTPLTFPIQWTKSKIDGVAVKISMPDFHELTLLTNMGTSRDRFFPPEIGGIIFNSPIGGSVFRIDHDQAFQQTTHVQYQWRKNGPWIGFNWRFDSGLVAGAVPDFASALALDADQQQTIGLYCGPYSATLSFALTPALCAGQTPFGATRVRIPAPGTEKTIRTHPGSLREICSTWPWVMTTCSTVSDIGGACVLQ